MERARVEAAKKADIARARETQQMDGKIGRSGRLARRVHIDAVMNAVDSEGPAVLSRDADSYWRDQERLYPWISTRPAGPVQSANGMRNRFGKVKEKLFFNKAGRLVTLTNTDGH
jgi:hypothetical protein